MTSLARLVLFVMFGSLLAAPVSAISAASALASDSTEITTTLYPGANLVGWTTADTSVGTLFRELPELQSVRTLSPGGVESVSRYDPPALDRLQTLRQGHGYWLHVESDSVVQWRREWTSEAAMLDLPTGQRLVAWSGVDDVALDRALLPIGEAVSSAWIWDARNQQFLIWSSQASSTTILSAPDPFGRRSGVRASPVSLQRGDAIGLSLTRAVTWRQPTGGTPSIDFRGRISSFHREVIAADVEYVTHFFARRFGFEVAPLHLEVIVPATPQDIFGPERTTWTEAESFASIPDRVSQRSKIQIVMPLPEWTHRSAELVVGENNSGRIILMHEYFHAVQAELAGGSALRQVPGWLAEGSAIALWDELGLSYVDRSIAMDRVSLISIDDAVDSFGPHDHELGALAFERLLRYPGDSAYFAFWRNLGTASGDEVTWQAAFARTFGKTPDDFYREFESWIRSYYPYVSGEIVDAENVDVESLHVSADVSGIEARVAQIDAQGHFRTSVPAGRDFHLVIGRDDRQCQAYVGEDGRPTEWRYAKQFSVGDSRQSGLTVDPGPEFCQQKIDGRIISSVSAAAVGLELSACQPDSLVCGHGVTDDRGEFSLRVPFAGRYTLTLIGDRASTCVAYFRDGGVSGSQERATRIAVPPGGNQSVRIEIGHALCSTTLSGRIAGLSSREDLFRREWDGELKMLVQLLLCPYEVGGRCVNIFPDADGRFTATLGGDGIFELMLKPSTIPSGIDGMHEDCVVYYPGQLRVRAGEEQSIEWTQSADFCRWRVRGLIQGLDGSPLPFRRIEVCQPGGLPYPTHRKCLSEVRSGADGAFDVRVPYSGDFVLIPATLFDCHYERQRRVLEEHGREVTIRGADVDLGVWRLPKRVCE